MRGSLATLLALAWLLGVGPLQGVYSQQYAAPSESECRPYIERALKEQGSPDTPPASIEDTGSSEETAGPEIPLNEQTDPEATTAETVPESEEGNSAENVGEVTSGETGEPTLEREIRSLDESASSDGVESLEQVDIPTAAEASLESAESLEGESPATEEDAAEGGSSLEQGEQAATEEASAESGEQGDQSATEEASAESGEQGDQSAAEEASAESGEQEPATEEASAESLEQGDQSATEEASAESGEQGEQSATEEASAESLEQGDQSATEEASTESGEQGDQPATEEASAESGEQGDQPATEEASAESGEQGDQSATEEASGESLEQGDQSATEEASGESGEQGETAGGAESTEDGSAESVEEPPAATSSENEQQESPIESTEADLTSSESLEQDATPESSESSEEAVPAEILESVEQDATPESSESSEEALPAESLESVEQDAAPESSESSEEALPAESLESVEQVAAPESSESSEEALPAESLESVEQDAGPESSESSEGGLPAESLEQDAAPESSEEAVPAESLESVEQDAAPESSEEAVPAESLEQEAAPIETTESSESQEETVPAESSEGLEPTEGAASEEQGSADSVESTEEATEAVSGEAAPSEEQDGEAAGVETVLARERRSLDEEGSASSEDKTEESSVEVLESADSVESVETTAEEPVAEQQVAEETEATPVADEEQAETSQEAPTAGEAAPAEVDEEEREVMPEEELSFDVDIPENLRPRDHIAQILKLDEVSVEDEMLVHKVEESTLKELKRLYDNAIKPLEILYKYRDLSNRHFGDPEIFSKPLILFMGPWSGGKSTIINYLLDNEYTRTTLRTGAEPSPAYFNLLMWGEREEVLDGTQLAADWTFSGLQKFGQGLLDRLRGLRLKNRLLEKVNIVEIPGILEIRKQVERLFPFNDACQWFIDRADIIFLVYDPSKLDVGPETEAILDQLKGREYQTRIVLNKADQVRPEELMRVQGTLIWNISPLMSSSQPPVMYSTSLWSMPYEAGAPLRLLRAQERAFLRDMREAIDKRVENKIASARRFAVRVRNHAKMVDCYLTTYYNHKSFFGNRKKISDDIIERPQDYHIYEGLSTLTNISRYDLPDPETYRDFFQLNPLYDFQQLAATCTYFKGCPINRLDLAIAYDLPELVGKYKKGAEIALEKQDPAKS